MNYSDIEIGQEYLYRSKPVAVLGMRVVAKANHSRDDEYSIFIAVGPISGREVHPHELSPIPPKPLATDSDVDAMVTKALAALAEANREATKLGTRLHPGFFQVSNECYRLHKEIRAFCDNYVQDEGPSA